jgi:Fe-S-cluster containining protein
MHIETNLSKIKHLASLREDENLRFRAFLKGKDGDKVDTVVHHLHKEITAQIDCTLCGNCCCRLKPELYEKDITKLSQIEGVTPENYFENYCEKDEYGDTYLKTIPCRYLNGKKCSIYENRPEECRHFPYTDKERFISRLFGMLNFYEFCPIVYNLMEQLKIEMRFRR